MPRTMSAPNIRVCVPSDQSDVGYTPEQVVKCVICGEHLHRRDSRVLRRCSLHWHTLPARIPRKNAYRAATSKEEPK